MREKIIQGGTIRDHGGEGKGGVKIIREEVKNNNSCFVLERMLEKILIF